MLEPLAGQPRHFIQRASLLEEVRLLDTGSDLSTQLTRNRRGQRRVGRAGQDCELIVHARIPGRVRPGGKFPWEFLAKPSKQRRSFFR
jgi:hypothetical protein